MNLDIIKVSEKAPEHDGRVIEETCLRANFSASTILWNSNYYDDRDKGCWLNRGSTGSFTVDLFTEVPIKQCQLRQTGNGTFLDYGTDDYAIDVSTDNEEWNQVFNGTLQARISCHVTETAWIITPPKNTVARYVRFRATSCHGDGVGLSHFAVKYGKTALEEKIGEEIDALDSKNVLGAIRRWRKIDGKKSDATRALALLESEIDPQVQKLEAILVRAKEALVEQKELVEARRKELAAAPTLTGLVNAGATCYLNDSLQALFMTPELRRGLYRWRHDESRGDLPPIIGLPHSAGRPAATTTFYRAVVKDYTPTIFRD